MMDLVMIAVLAGSFFLVKLFADFCESQVNPKVMMDMVILGIIILLLGGYLVYALVHPEKL